MWRISLFHEKSARILLSCPAAYAISVRMTMHSPLAKRYAGAVLDVASDQKAVSAVTKDMLALQDMMKSSDDFNAFVYSASIDNSQHLDGLEAIVKKAKLNKITLNFLKLLVKNNRLSMLGAIIAAFHHEQSLRNGLVDADVTLASEPSATQRKDIQAAVEAMTGHTITMNLHINPSILGGMIVKVGSYMVDDSVRGKLARLERKMTGSVA